MVQIWVVLMVALLAQMLCGGRDGSLAPQILTRNQTFERRLNESVCLPCQIRRQFTDPSRKCLFYWKKQSLDQSGVAKVVMKNGEWTRYRKEVRNNGSFHCLHIRNIRSGDHAKYVCEAISPLGGSSKVIHNLLVVNRHMEPQQAVPVPSMVPPPSAVPIPPFLITQATLVRTAALIHKNFYSGKRAKLKCAVKGDPQPEIKWYHNSRPLFPNHSLNHTHIRKKTFAVVINRFTNKHVGNWTCVAVNAAGTTNMTFLVSLLVGIPEDTKPPPVISREVSEGDNVTLRCKKPAKKVHMLTWNVPKNIQKAKAAAKARKHRHRGRDPSRFSKPPRRRDTGVLHLRNVSARTHAGEYKCVVVYKGRGRKVPFVIKIVKLVFPKGGDVLPDPTPISSEILLVKIAVPVMGSVLTLFVVIICFRCRRKTSLSNVTKTKVIEEDDDALSVQILPNIPMGTLRYHDNKKTNGINKLPCYHTNNISTHASLLLAELNANARPKDEERDASPRDDEPVVAMNPNVNSNENNNNDNESMINAINNNNNNDVNNSENVISSLCEPNQLTTSVDEDALQNDEMTSENLEDELSNRNLQNSNLQNEEESEPCSTPCCECSVSPGDDTQVCPRCIAAEECDNTDLRCKCTDWEGGTECTEMCRTSNDPPERCRLSTDLCKSCGSLRRRYDDEITTTFVDSDLHTSDLLVQREIKNWEPLRESKSSYGVGGTCRRTKSGGDRCENDRRTNNSNRCDRGKCQLLRSRSYCEQKRTMQSHPAPLSPQHNNNTVLRSLSDCSRRIIT